MKKFSISDIMKHDELEKKKFAISTILNGINAVSMKLDEYYLFEDFVFNNDFKGALEVLKDKNLPLLDCDRVALTFVFESALNL